MSDQGEVQSFEVEAAPDAVPLYPVGAIALATFLGSALAGAIVFALNYRRLGRPEAAVLAVVLGAIGTAATIFFALNTPDEMPGVLLWLPVILVMVFLAKAQFGRLLEERAADGIPPAGMGVPAAIGGGFLVAMLAGFGVAILTDSPFPGEKLTLGNDDIFYSGGATEEQARKLAEVLTEEGFLGNAGVSVHLEKDGEHYAVDFVLIEKAWKNEEVVAAFRTFGEKIADAGFGRPVTIRLCDDTASVQKTIVVE